jgi:hypothetical protein
MAARAAGPRCGQARFDKCSPSGGSPVVIQIPGLREIVTRPAVPTARRAYPLGVDREQPARTLRFEDTAWTRREHFSRYDRKT